MASPRSLTTVLLDGKEAFKKTCTLGNVKDITEACTSALSCKAEMTRIMKFCSDFKEYIDVDVNCNVENMDKFQILFKSIQSDVCDVRATAVTTQEMEVQQVCLFNVC